MPLHPNNELLKRKLESLPLLDNRFSNLKLVNFSEEDDRKRGCFSMVFRAHDTAENKTVALKFFDLDPRWRNDVYRINSFKREHEILQGLLNVDRCLQLASALSTCTIEETIDGVPGVSFSADYFAVDWLSDEIDSYFLAQGDFGPIEKLKIFNEIVLAVETLHSHEVFHRDLKADNLRAHEAAVKRMVIAIDLGTAARFDSDCISTTYGHSVGAHAYAAPEAICGLAGNRTLAPFTDYYALGCMLFELFNPDYFFQAVRNWNRNFDLRLCAMAGELSGVSGRMQEVESWDAVVRRFGVGVTPVAIDGDGSSLPKGISKILNELLEVLTHIDYKKRKAPPNWIRQKLWTAIRVLENEAEYARRLRFTRERRERRERAARDKEARLAAARLTSLPC
ncbi:MAG: Serine/threonine-protein kinase PrkC [Alphaproteobacteria bacterium ADurb.BinA280]|jgi:serine/threonine protein kinase|nr:MAG: Serine/threonine-protein kinase PrkC [Alphaproteobacteria bacterium ADurb.BinA280]